MKGTAATKKSLFAVIRQLALVCRGSLQPHLALLMPHVLQGVNSKNDAALKGEALVLLFLFLQHQKVCRARGLYLPWLAVLEYLCVGVSTDVTVPESCR